MGGELQKKMSEAEKKIGEASAPEWFAFSPSACVAGCAGNGEGAAPGAMG